MGRQQKSVSHIMIKWTERQSVKKFQFNNSATKIDKCSGEPIEKLLGSRELNSGSASVHGQMLDKKATILNQFQLNLVNHQKGDDCFFPPFHHHHQGSKWQNTHTSHVRFRFLSPIAPANGIESFSFRIFLSFYLLLKKPNKCPFFAFLCFTV